jgi:hypothetical protein
MESERRAEDRATQGQMASAVAKKMQEVTKGAAPAADVQHDESGHVTFLKVPEEQKSQRANERKRWREPLYKLPVGMFLQIPRLGACCAGKEE